MSPVFYVRKDSLSTDQTPVSLTFQHIGIPVCAVCSYCPNNFKAINCLELVLQGVPEVLKRFCSSCVDIVTNRLRQTSHQNESDWTELLYFGKRSVVG